MATLKLNPEELTILKEILENYLSDLRMEISHTDRLDFREQLKLRKQVVQKVLEQLETSDEA